MFDPSTIILVLIDVAYEVLLVLVRRALYIVGVCLLAAIILSLAVFVVQLLSLQRCCWR